MTKSQHVLHLISRLFEESDLEHNDDPTTEYHQTMHDIHNHLKASHSITGLKGDFPDYKPEQGKRYTQQDVDTAKQDLSAVKSHLERMAKIKTRVVL